MGRVREEKKRRDELFEDGSRKVKKDASPYIR